MHGALGLLARLDPRLLAHLGLRLLARLAPGVRHDLTVMVDPSALAEVERVALEKGLDASPTTPTVYLQRLQALSVHLRDAVFPTADRDDGDVAALTLDDAKLLDAEAHADDDYEAHEYSYDEDGASYDDYGNDEYLDEYYDAHNNYGGGAYDDYDDDV